MDELKIPITRCLMFVDAISTLLSLRQHPARYKPPLRNWFAATNINLFKCAQISKQLKENIPVFINQTKRVNFADLLTKFNLTKDTSDVWLEMQKRLLTPNWLRAHPSVWLKDVLEESAEKISIQSQGGVVPDFTGPGQSEESRLNSGGAQGRAAHM